MSAGKTCFSFNEYLEFLKDTLANTGFTCPSIEWEASIKSIINKELSGVRVLHVKNTATSKIDTYVNLPSAVAGLINNIGGNPFHLKVCCYGLACLKPVGRIDFDADLTKTYHCGDNSVENDTDQLNNIINTGSRLWFKSLENNNLSLPSRINLADGQPLTALDDIFQNNRTDPTISGQYVGCTDGLTCIQNEMLGGTNTTWLYWIAEFSENAQILMSPLYADLLKLDAFYQKCQSLTNACSRAPDKCSWRLENLKDYLPKALSKYTEIKDCLQYYTDPDAEPKNPGKIWSHMLTEDCYNIYRSMRDTYGLKNFVITQGLITWFQGLRAQLEASLGDNSVIGTPDACKRCAGDEECLESCLKANEALEKCFEKCDPDSSAVSECERQCRVDCNTICGADVNCKYACLGGTDLEECKDFIGCPGHYMNVTGNLDVCESDEYNADDISFSPDTDICTIDPTVFRVAPCDDSDGDGIIVIKKSGKTSKDEPGDDACKVRDGTVMITDGFAWQPEGSCSCRQTGNDYYVNLGPTNCCKIDAYGPQSGVSKNKITLEKLATKDNCVVTSNPPLDNSSSYPNYKSITFSCKISDNIQCNCEQESQGL